MTATLSDRVPFNACLAFGASICDGPAGGASGKDGGQVAYVIWSFRTNA